MKNTADSIPKVFLDTNILVDYLLFRGEEALAIEYIIDRSLDRQFELCIASHSLSNAYYILRKDYSPAERRFFILNMCALCHVIPISKNTIEKAIASGYAVDVEDALQIQCALESDCDYFITRDRELFEKCPVRTLLPHELIKELSL